MRRRTGCQRMEWDVQQARQQAQQAPTAAAAAEWVRWRFFSGLFGGGSRPAGPPPQPSKVPRPGTRGDRSLATSRAISRPRRLRHSSNTRQATSPACSNAPAPVSLVRR